MSMLLVASSTLSYQVGMQFAMRPNVAARATLPQASVCDDIVSDLTKLIKEKECGPIM